MDTEAESQPRHRSKSPGTTAITFNNGYLKKLPGVLKLSQLILGIVCVSITAWNLRKHYGSDESTEFFFLLIAVSFLIGTFCLLLSCLLSASAGQIIARTNYEWIYHGVAFIFYAMAGIALLGTATSDHDMAEKNTYLAISIIGLAVSLLYLTNFIVALFTYLKKS